MNRQFFAWVAFIIILSTPAVGQEIIQVEDGVTGKPLVGATLDNGSQLLVTDEKGQVLLSEKPAGTFQVQFIGYHSKKIHLTRPLEERVVIRLFPSYEMLQAVTVKAYEDMQPVRNVPGSISVLPVSGMENYGVSGLTTVFNAVPGMRLEERSPGSYRVNIRGSTLRSPYGVRNVKVYLQDIPLTDPTGSTPLNLIDPYHFDHVSVIRGPTGSTYGSGYGGALLFQPNESENEGWGSGISLLTGSYGRRKFDANIQYSGTTKDIRIAFSKNTYDGYRDQTEFDRSTVDAMGRYGISKKDELNFTLVYSDLFYELPGGLTYEQMEADPQAARQIAVDQHSSIDQQYFLAGLSNKFDWNDKGGNETSVFLSSSQKVNPFITNYETEDFSSHGIRSRFYQTLKAGMVDVCLIAGGEWQFGSFDANNYGNVAGQPDSLRYLDENKVISGYEFLQTRLSYHTWELSMAASINHLRYDFSRVTDISSNDILKVRRNFSSVVVPRLGLVNKINSDFSVFANVSGGFSPPTQEEVRTSDGDINTDLDAERAISFEIGSRTTLVKDKLFVDLTLFTMRVDKTIVNYTDEEGNSLFRNSGRTHQQGLETQITWQALKNRDPSWCKSLRMEASLTWNQFKFVSYKLAEDQDYGGNKLTGSMPISFDYQMEWEHKSGLYSTIHYSYGSRIPLNDANTAYSENYHLIELGIGKSFHWNEKLTMIVDGGVNNLLNERYSLGNDLNAFGGRYFNPSPDRNYFLRLRFNWSQ